MAEEEEVRLGVAGCSAGSTEACFQLGGSLHAGDAIPPAGCQSQAARVPLPLPDWSLSECDRGGWGRGGRTRVGGGMRYLQWARVALGLQFLQSLLDSWQSNFSICCCCIATPQYFHGNSR